MDKLNCSIDFNIFKLSIINLNLLTLKKQMNCVVSPESAFLKQKERKED